jgi:small subunit ribosomal protein S7
MRGRRASKRKLEPDVRYNSLLVSRLIKKVMLHGKKKLAENIVYNAIEAGGKKTKLDPEKFLDEAMANIRPALEVKARRVGGANYHVPTPVTPVRQDTLAVRWVVDATRKKTGKSFEDLLSMELMNAFNNEGDAVKKKIDVEKMAEANKAFAHFRW